MGSIVPRVTGTASRRRRGARSSACLVVLAALAVAALGAVAVPALPLQEADITVRLQDIEFHPSRIEASEGDTIRFVNDDPFEHDVYLVRAANPNDVVYPATEVAAGDSLTVSLDEGGLFDLYCTIHGGMSGKVTTIGRFELTEEEREAAAARRVVPPIARRGEELFWAEAQCHQCHRIGERGDAERGPNLENIGFRADVRAEDLGLDNGTEYIVQSLQDPSAHVVQGFSDDMATVYWPPVDLGEEQLTQVVAYLQSRGGEVDDWLIDFDPAVIGSEPPPNPYADGDPAAGAEVYTRMGCDSCHRVGDSQPVSVGPELTDIGAFRDWQWIETSILDPNDEIGANWKRTTVHLKDGTDHTGTLRRNTSEEVVLLVGPDDQTRSFDGDRVERVEIHDATRMPGNYGELMTDGQLADLIAYLLSLKGEAAAGGG